MQAGRLFIGCFLACMLLSLTAFAQQQDSSQTNVEHLIEEDTPSLSLDSIVEQHVVYDPNTDTYTIEQRIDGRLIAPPVIMTQEEYRCGDPRPRKK